MRHILAIYKKQLKDIFKNKEVLIQFLMFPAIAVIMENGIRVEGMSENFFVNMFATMYIGMAPLTSMASVIAEEREKNTLRVLLLSNVKPWEYLIGVGSYIFVICMLGSVVFALTGGMLGRAFAEFMLVMAVGILTSLFMGAVIGVGSRNQMMATSITVPVMLVFSFLPMLSMFNDDIKKVAEFTYSQKISRLLSQTGNMQIQKDSVQVIGANMGIAVLLFFYAYKKGWSGSQSRKPFLQRSR